MLFQNGRSDVFVYTNARKAEPGMTLLLVHDTYMVTRLLPRAQVHVSRGFQGGSWNSNAPYPMTRIANRSLQKHFCICLAEAPRRINNKGILQKRFESSRSRACACCSRHCWPLHRRGRIAQQCMNAEAAAVATCRHYWLPFHADQRPSPATNSKPNHCTCGA